MKTAASGLAGAIGERRRLFCATMAGFILVYYAGLLVTMVVRFGNFPNYVTFYNWPANVWRILEGTPSLTDAVNIISEEWLLEAGYMTYDYGNGISVWALTIMPPKLALIVLVAALAASIVVLLMPPKAAAACPAAASRAGAIATATGGASLVGLSCATLSWVVCCATPTWVVSLAMMGMSVSLALWLQPFGDALTIAGFLLLLVPLWKLARRRAQSDRVDDPPPAYATGLRSA